jgi:acetyl esterase/lipase
MDDVTHQENAVLAGMLRSFDRSHGDLARLRADYDRMGEMMPVPETVRVVATEIGGVPCEVLTPSDAQPGAVMLFLHGGAYVIGSPRSHRGLASQLAAASGAVTVVPDYRLAPEHPFPAALEDAGNVYQGLLAQGYDASKLVIAGDSAGGGLSLVTAMAIVALGLPRPAALGLLSPWTDLTGSGATMVTKAGTDLIVNKDDLLRMAAFYAGNDAFTSDPGLSPLFGRFEGLPPIYVQVGADEALLSDATRLAEAAGTAHVPVMLEVWPHMQHVFQFFYPLMTAGREAIGRMGGFIRAHQA